MQRVGRSIRAVVIISLQNKCSVNLTRNVSKFLGSSVSLKHVKHMFIYFIIYCCSNCTFVSGVL